VNNVFEKTNDFDKCKNIDFTKCQQLNAVACGVGLRTVQRIHQGVRTEGHFVSPKKKKAKSKSVTKLDDFEKDIIKRTVHDMYAGEFLQLKKILVS
jgi:hypothetical protein